MAKFKNLLNINTDYSKLPKQFFEIFKDDYKEMVLLLRLMDTMLAFNSWDKLQEDKSFYISITKIEELFFNSVSRPTIIKMLVNLEKKGFIKIKKSNNPKQANFYKINCEKINKFCNTKTKRIYEEEEIETSRIKEGTKIIEISELTKTTKSNDIELATKLWNERIANKYMLIQGIKGITGTREKNFKTRLKESKLSVEEFIDNLEKHIASSDFLQGFTERGWVVSFSWAMKPDNYLKIVEDNYRNITSEERGKAINEAVFRNWKD